jgi:hypothetical protein
MPIERKPADGTQPPTYPTRAEYTHDRRRFMGLLGLGAMGAGAYAVSSALLGPSAALADEPPAEPLEPLPGDQAPVEPEPAPDVVPAKPEHPLRGEPSAPADPPDRATTALDSPDTVEPPPEPAEPRPPKTAGVPPPRRVDPPAEPQVPLGGKPRPPTPEEPPHPQEEPPAEPLEPLPGEPVPESCPDDENQGTKKQPVKHAR